MRANKTKVFVLRMTDKEHDRLKRQASAADLFMSEYILKLINKQKNHNGKEK